MDRFYPPGGAFPIGGSDIEIEEPAERFLTGLDARTTASLKLALLGFEYLPVLILRKRKRFTSLDEEDQARYIERWNRSRSFLMRTAFLWLKLMCSMLFYSNDEVEKQVGYERHCLKKEPGR